MPVSRTETKSAEYLDWINSLAPVAHRHCWGTAVSLFSGGGGLDLGMRLAGLNVAFSSDLEEVNCKTIESNLPGTTTSAENIDDLDGKSIKKAARTNEIDVVFGGPPCQSFSILGKRGSFEDPRGKLIYEFLRIIKELKPKAFIFENVPGLLTLNGGKDWSNLLQLFREETGFVPYPIVLNSADFGVPQIRKRVFVVGIRGVARGFSFLDSTHSNPKDVTLFAAGKPAWLPCDVVFDTLNGVPNHDIRLHGPRVLARYKKIPQGGRDRIDHSDRLELGKPSGTVLVGSKAGGGRPHIHPTENRVITVREAARLQSFPDWYKFEGSSTDQYRQVGNAVPPVLAMYVGLSLKRALRG